MKRNPGRGKGSMRSFTAITLLALFLGGCLVGHNYRRPTVDVPQSWRIAENDARDLVNTPWWEQFDDPVLNELIVTAIKENKDLLIATARIEEFRQRYAIARAPLFPQVVAGASAGRQRTTLQG